MMIKNLAACVSALALSFAVVPAFASNVQQSGASMPKLKIVTSLSEQNVAGVPGETKVLEATLLGANNAAVAGKSVVFRIYGKNGTSVPNGHIVAGTGVTDGAGHAKLSYALPELAQGNYELKASFAGDEAFASSSVDANLLMVKGITKVELGDLIWGTYKNEPGAPYGVVGFSLKRTSDGKALSKPLTITVNGNTWTISGDVYHQIALPTNTTTWTVKVQYEGDGVYAATASTRTYHKP
jgi:hypothetical protein